MKPPVALIMLLAACIASPASALEYRIGFSGGNCSTCAWIAADGEIGVGDAEKLMDFIRNNDLANQKLIVINSPGGNVSAALELGSVVRERGIRVIVGRTGDDEPEGANRTFQFYESGTCASACVFVLMGGVKRELADDDSQVGVHQFAPVSDAMSSIAATTSSAQSLLAILQQYAGGMGINPAVLTLAATTRPEEMLWLTPKQMEGLNLLTSRDYRQLANWALKPAGNLLIATASQEQANGRTTGLVVDCRFIHFGFQVPDSDRASEIAAAIRGGNLNADYMSSSMPLTMTDVSVRGRMILVSFQGGVRILDAIARANDRMNIEIDLPWVYMEEFGGPQFDIPTSNLAEVSSHVLNSCK